MAKNTEHFLFSKEHEWLEMMDDHKARIGITFFAQQELGDIVFIEMPDVGDEIVAGESMGTIESVKAVSDIFTPVSGEVVKVNEELEHAPETINSDPYNEGWLVEVRISDNSQLKNLMNEKEYRSFIEQGEE